MGGLTEKMRVENFSVLRGGLDQKRGVDTPLPTMNIELTVSDENLLIIRPIYMKKTTQDFLQIRKKNDRVKLCLYQTMGSQASNG